MKLVLISSVVALLAFLAGASFSSKIIKTQFTPPSPNEKIAKFVEIRKGEEVLTQENIKVPTTELVVTYTDGMKDILESTTPDQAKQHISLTNSSLSPDNKFVIYNQTGWESSRLKILRLSDKKDIFEPYKDKIYPAFPHAISWFDNDKILVISSVVNRLDGTGKGGLFISDVGKPEQLNEVIQFSDQEDLLGSKVDQVTFDGRNIRISVTRFPTVSPNQPPFSEFYLYNIESKKLEKLSNP